MALTVLVFWPLKTESAISPPLTLPNEFLAQIIDEAANSFALYTRCRHTELAKLCLVSETFLSLARARLYELFHLEFEKT